MSRFFDDEFNQPVSDWVTIEIVDLPNIFLRLRQAFTTNKDLFYLMDTGIPENQLLIHARTAVIAAPLTNTYLIATELDLTEPRVTVPYSLQQLPVFIEKFASVLGVRSVDVQPGGREFSFLIHFHQYQIQVKFELQVGRSGQDNAVSIILPDQEVRVSEEVFENTLEDYRGVVQQVINALYKAANILAELNQESTHYHLPPEGTFKFEISEEGQEDARL